MCEYLDVSRVGLDLRQGKLPEVVERIATWPSATLPWRGTRETMAGCGGMFAAAFWRATDRCGSDQNGHVWKEGHLKHSGRREQGEIRRNHGPDVRKVGYPGPLRRKSRSRPGWNAPGSLGRRPSRTPSGAKSRLVTELVWVPMRDAGLGATLGDRLPVRVSRVAVAGRLLGVPLAAILLGGLDSRLAVLAPVRPPLLH